MSKNKHYKNYNNYSNPKAEVKEEAVVEETVEVTEIEEVAVEETVEEQVVEPEVEEEKQITGKVAGCARLRVRKTPNTTADVLCEIDENSEVVIDESKSTVDFYAVTTSAGAEGFCMKKFIKIN